MITGDCLSNVLVLSLYLDFVCLLVIIIERLIQYTFDPSPTKKKKQSVQVTHNCLEKIDRFIIKKIHYRCSIIMKSL